MLIERGADVTAQNNDGSTPLNPATRKGQVDAARLFIECGVDVTAQNVNNNRETLLLLHLASTPSYFTRMFQANMQLVFFSSMVYMSMPRTRMY
jgi:ankyrin repeat protein